MTSTKRYVLPLLAVIVLALGLGFPLYANTVQPSGSGGGGAPFTGTGVPTTYINLVADEGALCSGIDVFDGAMDNNVTATLTSASALFSAAMASRGDLVCVEGAGAAGIQKCGTVVTFTDTSHVVLSFQNTSGGAISGKEAGIATNDSTPFTNALTLAGTSHRPIFVPTGYCGMNTNFTFPANSVVLTGAGMGTTSTLNGANDQQLHGTTLWFLSTSMTTSTPAIAISNALNASNNRTEDVINDISIRAGVGHNRDGGGTTVDGLDTLNWHGLQLNRVAIQGFSGSCEYIDTRSTTAATNNVYGIDHEMTTWQECGVDGLRVGTTALATNDAAVQLQNIHVGDASQANNGSNGFNFASNCVNCVINGASLAQGNNRANNGSSEIVLQADGAGSKIDGNYIESDLAGAVGINASPGHTILGWGIMNNFMVTNGTPTTAGITVGTGAGTFGAGGQIINNLIHYNTCISLTAAHVDPNVPIWNSCNGTYTQGGAGFNGLFGTATVFDPGFSGQTAGSSLELKSPQAQPPRNMVVNTDQTTINQYIGAYDFNTQGTAATDKRVAEINAFLTASSVTTPTARLGFGTANGGTETEKMWLYPSGGLFVGSSATDAGAGNIQALNNLSAGALISATGGAVISSTGGSIPTATCSGGSTGVSIAAGSTNNRGQIVTSSSASTNCTITWSATRAWPQAPFCTVDDAAASITPTLVSVGATGTSTMVIDFASASTKTFNWVCL